MSRSDNPKTAGLHSGQVIANHILVSFHVAFISSLLNIPSDLFGPAVLRFVFMSYETIISTVFWFVCFHSGIAIHEMGHYLRAVRLNALHDDLLPIAIRHLNQGFLKRIIWYVKMFLTIPYGSFRGVKKEGLTYYPEAPFNLSVSAAGPQVSGRLALLMLPVAAVLLVLGLGLHYDVAVYAGRLCLGLGAVGLLDFFLADPGKYKEYKQRESRAKLQSQRVEGTASRWEREVVAVKEKMMKTRMQEITLPNGEKLRAPWQFRNCGMGGRHTEKEYPESNISFQELMFVPLCARDYEEAQMITVSLQTRLKEVIEKERGARVMGIGLEGGLAPFVSKDTEDTVPEQRLWVMAVQAIRDCGYTPGKDIAIAFDPAMSELSTSYRKEFNQADAVGMYYFWRSEEKVVMSRDQMMGLLEKTMSAIPVVSFEDAYAEDDYEGWRMLMRELGDKVFVIGDDLVTTNDAVIEKCADDKLINTALIKANQIGTLSETLLAMLVALGKGLELVVSHRSKSPNDDMEAQIALAANAVGLKTGGGANTERLLKYGAVNKIMKTMAKIVVHKEKPIRSAVKQEWIGKLVITDITAFEEPTNAGIPTVGVEVCVGMPDSKRYYALLKFSGATPLGTSAGTGEAIHLVDSVIEKNPVVERYNELFSEQQGQTFVFKKKVNEEDISKHNDPALVDLWRRSQRYGGKGCLNAVDNVLNIIAPEFIGKPAEDFSSLIELDRRLLSLEAETAMKRGKINKEASLEERISLLQRKGNLGMNAILSVSLAIARMIAHLQGKDLWQLLREQMKETIARTVATNTEIKSLQDIVPAKALKKIQEAGQEKWEVLRDALTFEELVHCLREVEGQLKKKDKKLYEVLRQQMPIYNTAAT